MRDNRNVVLAISNIPSTPVKVLPRRTSFSLQDREYLIANFNGQSDKCPYRPPRFLAADPHVHVRRSRAARPRRQPVASQRALPVAAACHLTGHPLQPRLARTQAGILDYVLPGESCALAKLQQPAHTHSAIAAQFRAQSWEISVAAGDPVAQQHAGERLQPFLADAAVQSSGRYSVGSLHAKGRTAFY